MSLEFVTATFLAPDPAKVEKLIAEDAQWKNRGPGSALKVVSELQQKREEIVEGTRLREIHFFTAAELPEIPERFAELESSAKFLRSGSGRRGRASIEGGHAAKLRGGRGGNTYLH